MARDYSGAPARAPGARVPLLALETATEACSVALHAAADVHQRHRVAPRRHTELVLGMIDAVLDEAACARESIAALAYGRGPGSFTGVRIAAALAQGIAAARRIPVIGVSTLHALAATAARGHDSARVLCALDARRGEVYFAAYAFDAGAPFGRALIPDGVLAPEAVTAAGGDWLYAGNGWRVHAGRFAADLRAPAAAAVEFPEALDLARVALAGGAAGPAHTALPVYLRGAVD